MSRPHSKISKFSLLVQKYKNSVSHEHEQNATKTSSSGNARILSDVMPARPHRTRDYRAESGDHEASRGAQTLPAMGQNRTATEEPPGTVTPVGNKQAELLIGILDERNSETNRDSKLHTVKNRSTRTQ